MEARPTSNPNSGNSAPPHTQNEPQPPDYKASDTHMLDNDNGDPMNPLLRDHDGASPPPHHGDQHPHHPTPPHHHHHHSLPHRGPPPPHCGGRASPPPGCSRRSGRCHPGQGWQGRGGPWGWGRRGGHHPFGGHGWAPRDGMPWDTGRGGWDARAGAPPFEGGFSLDAILQFLRDNFGFDPRGDGNNANPDNSGPDTDFSPQADVFDTTDAFVVHVALAGAKKQDLGVSYDRERSELTVAGVIHRPGDEQFLQTLALGERSIGAFERKIRLGSRSQPASVDSDAISARMEDGVLIVHVPKVEEFVEVKKVDIE